MSGKGDNSNQMSQADASRIQSSQVSLHFAKGPKHSLIIPKAKGDKDMSSGGFAARAQSAAATNTNTAAQQGGKEQAPSGKK